MSEEPAKYAATTAHMAAKAFEKLHSIYTAEQLQQIADLCERLIERARERGCEQSLEIIFADSGAPRYFNGSDNVRAARVVRKIEVVKR